MSLLGCEGGLLAFASPGPDIVQLGPLTVRWYGVLIASAVLLGLALAGQLARRRNVNPTLMGDLVVWLIVGAIPMARAYYVAFRWDYYSQNLGEIIAIWQGGIAIHGAIIGGTIATLIFAKLEKLPFWKLADILAPCLILGQAIGRWGNFFNSEAFGVPTDLPWKLYIPAYRRPPDLVEYQFFHPTFLYESLWNVGVLGILLTIFFRYPKAKPRTLVCTYVIACSLGQAWIEGLRIDSLYLGSLGIAQVVSIASIVFGALGLMWLYDLKRQLPEITPEMSASVKE